MDKEHCFMKMETNILVSLKMETCMETENSNNQMEQVIKENSKMIKDMEMAFLLKRTVKSTKASLKIIKSMDLELKFIRMAKNM
jgi:hypothetical protein